MRDPYNIDLQSTDPDLEVSPDDAMHNGADDLMDYAASIGVYGETTVAVLTDDSPAVPGAASPKRAGGCRRSPFHPSLRLTAPFAVAALVAVLIVVIVLIPTGGN